MHRLIPVLVLSALVPGAVAADEVTDVLEGALAAYRAGDVEGARQDLDYAGRLLTEMKAAGLADFLPAADGWTRESADPQGPPGMAMAMFGGGASAAATYRRGDAAFTLTLVANAPMVSGIAAMMSGVTSLAGSQSRRIQRTDFAVEGDGLQGVIDGKVLVSASGTATIDDMAAVIGQMDFAALAAY